MPLANANIKGTADKLSRFDFDVVADAYDQWYETDEGAMYDRLERKVISRFLRQNVQVMKLLEVGCGTGHWSQFFSDCGFEVTGVDISERMIKIAQSKNMANASFQLADGHSLPFEDKSFDVTAAITTLEFVRDAELVLRERRNMGVQQFHGDVAPLTTLRARSELPSDVLAMVRVHQLRRGWPLCGVHLC